MEEELKKWNVKAVQAQLVACKIKSSGLKEELVPRLAACPQFKPIFAAIMADPNEILTSVVTSTVKEYSCCSGRTIVVYDYNMIIMILALQIERYI